MVGRLVHYKHVIFAQGQLYKGYPRSFAAAERRNRFKYVLSLKQHAGGAGTGLSLVHSRTGRPDFLKNSVVKGEPLLLLRIIALFDSGAPIYAARIGPFQTGQQAEQGGFARAVAAYKGNPVPRLYFTAYILKYEL